VWHSTALFERLPHRLFVHIAHEGAPKIQSPVRPALLILENDQSAANEKAANETDVLRSKSASFQFLTVEWLL
jgi:hypothetical protein